MLSFKNFNNRNKKLQQFNNFKEQLQVGLFVPEKANEALRFIKMICYFSDIVADIFCDLGGNDCWSSDPSPNSFSFSNFISSLVAFIPCYLLNKLIRDVMLLRRFVFNLGEWFDEGNAGNARR
ncbi:unnamed protein product [Lactuca saligna]|uniref:Uncharacterized protein n=1 Tax=Lactuca saligna TaxID=75948 RepID=A0AA35UVD7_LACSI|nr:unnamed protein product [Lactuca saligna]